MSKFEQDYRDLLTRVKRYGHVKDNRTDVTTLSSFNQSLNIDLTDGFPILTGKQIFFDKAEAEYKWMMNGLSTTKFLKDNDIHWWDDYADANGELGITYGTSLRAFNNTTDQLEYAMRMIREGSRRAHITLWEAHRLEEALLPPCLTGFTFYRAGDTLSLALQLRSSDLFLGLPYDIIMTALMLIDVARFTETKPGLIGIQMTDAHIYVNHFKAVDEYIKQPLLGLPTLYSHPVTRSHHIIGYKHGPFIKAKMNN